MIPQLMTGFSELSAFLTFLAFICFPFLSIFSDYGNAYMDKQGISYQSAMDLWLNEIALLALAFGFLILTYIQLRRIKKLK